MSLISIRPALYVCLVVKFVHMIHESGSLSPPSVPYVSLSGRLSTSRRNIALENAISLYWKSLDIVPIV